ncbi:MAG: T9SS type A sorting domain-containing protein [Bacteroidales bacterium]|nr:T9SS type A sorting domain-containing protein [Bacteroidales bacterium]
MKTIIKIITGLAFLVLCLQNNAYPQGKFENDNAYCNGSSTSYIKFNGNGDMILMGKNADQTELGNVVVDFTGNSINKLIIPDDSYITVNGNLVLWDTLLLEASTLGMASLITNGAVSGNYAKVEQHLPAQDEWHLVSSPVTSATASVYAGCYLLRWQEPDSIWNFITSQTYPLTVTQGYSVWSESGIGSPVDVVFEGLLNTGNQAPTVTYNNGSGKGDGWNLLGNPYSSAIEWNASWTKSNIDATMYVYNGTQYLTWNYNLGGFGTKTDGAIPSTQGFWIKANAASPSITIPNSERVHSAQGFYKSSGSVANILNIEVTGNGYTDHALIGLYGGATDLFDSEYDAYKIWGINAAPQLYTVIRQDKLAVNILAAMVPDLEQKTIPLNLEAGEAGIYTFNFSGLGDFDPGISIYLEDRYSSGPGIAERKLINIWNSSQYSFTAMPQDYPGRFFIHFNMKVEEHDISPGNDLAGKIMIYSFGKNVNVLVKDLDAGVTIFDLLGQKVLSEHISSDILNQFHLNSPQGYYIVNVVTAEGLHSEKVFIH